MAAGILLVPGWTPAVDSDGAPIPNARAYYYLDETTTLAPIFADEGLTTPLTNPVEANSSGRWPIIWASDANTYTWSIEAPYGPPGLPFTGTGLTASQSTDLIILEGVNAAADQADDAAALALDAYNDILALAASLPDTDPIVIAGKANVSGSNILGANQAAFPNSLTVLQNGTGSVARTIPDKLRDWVSLLDFIPVSEHAAIRARTSTYDCSASIAAAHLASPCVIAPGPGRYVTGDMVELGFGGIGQRGIVALGGADFHRLDVSKTTPMFWLKSDGCFLRGAAVAANKISSAARCPEGLVLIGHRNMTVSHANLTHCQFSGFRVTGAVSYGQTTGSPDVGVKFCNPQLGGLASYEHHVNNILVENVNYGYHFQGFANGNFLGNLKGQYIGNPTLSAHRALCFWDGAQQNQLFGCFLHYSPGTDCWKFRDYDNTATPGGFLHVPSINQLYGECEQDPGGTLGYGIDAPDASCTGQFNNLNLRDNIASNNIGPTFSSNNDIALMGSKSIRGITTLANELRAFGGGRMNSQPLYLAGVGDNTWSIQQRGAVGSFTAGIAIQVFGVAGYGAAVVTPANAVLWQCDGVGDTYSTGHTDIGPTKSYKVGGTQVVSARNTGWTAATGTGSKGAFAAAAAGTASAAYVQAELQGALNRIAALEARMVSIDAMLRIHGLIN